MSNGFGQGNRSGSNYRRRAFPLACQHESHPLMGTRLRVERIGRARTCPGAGLNCSREPMTTWWTTASTRIARRCARANAGSTGPRTSTRSWTASIPATISVSQRSRRWPRQRVHLLVAGRKERLLLRRLDSHFKSEVRCRPPLPCCCALRGCRCKGYSAVTVRCRRINGFMPKRRGVHGVITY